MTDSAASTPLPKRRLGLRLPKGARTTPGIRHHARQAATTPLSEDSSNKITTVALETPRASQPKPKANSTHCRRIGLSRRRPELSKKRLEFIATKEKCKENPAPDGEILPQKLEWRQRKILELEADIATWKCGFVAALNDLQALVSNPVSMETLLTQLKLPLELMQYLEEEED
ncbi:hypothetical protein KR044_012982 [Drosophila immigrans]|nr:hypothetical protein KR044_012982 [Drosophila immigrans]